MTTTDLDLLGQLLPAQEARRLLSRLGGLHAISRAGVAELRRVGLSPPRARRLYAALELGRRAMDEPLVRGEPILCAGDVWRRLRARLGGLDQEELHVLGLDPKSRVVVHAVVARGTTDEVPICPRDVFRPLLREAATRAIVVHNHPSGDCTPSGADVQLTQRLLDAGALVGVALVDHVVITRTGRFSFAEAGRLGRPTVDGGTK